MIRGGIQKRHIADHATNIAEEVIYYLSGKTIMHHLEDVKKEQ